MRRHRDRARSARIAAGCHRRVARTGTGPGQLHADLLEVIEARAQRRSTIVASQLPVALWHDALGAPTPADALLDRLVHNAHCIELRGESLRRARDHPDPA